MFFIVQEVSLLLYCFTLACGLSISTHNKPYDKRIFDGNKEDSSFSGTACDNSPCKNGGFCIVDWEIEQGFLCECHKPWRGRTCEENYACDDLPCENEGICVPDENPPGFRCVCNGRWKGETCKVSTACDGSPCKNGGFCYVDRRRQSYLCECHEPWRGETCEENYACHNAPCKNDGLCTTDPEPPGFKCTCIDNWKGYTCEEEWIETTPLTETDPIKETTDNYHWTLNDTSEFTDTFNQTTDTYGWTSYEPSNFTGDFNTTYIPTNFTDDYNVSLYEIKNFTESYNLTSFKPDICEDDDDCLNGGACEIKDDQNYCLCRPNFSGHWCQVSVLCKMLESTCRAMGATCKIIGFNAICECPQEQMYNPSLEKCENICEPWRCLHGTCKIVDGTFKCNCDSGYTGENCNEKVKVNPTENQMWFIVIATILILICLFLTGMICLYRRTRS